MENWENGSKHQGLLSLVARNKAEEENWRVLSRGGGLCAVLSRLLRKVHAEKVTMELRLAGRGDLGKEAPRQWEESTRLWGRSMSERLLPAQQGVRAWAKEREGVGRGLRFRDLPLSLR